MLHAVQLEVASFATWSCYPTGLLANRFCLPSARIGTLPYLHEGSEVHANAAPNLFKLWLCTMTRAPQFAVAIAAVISLEVWKFVRLVSRQRGCNRYAPCAVQYAGLEKLAMQVPNNTASTQVCLFVSLFVFVPSFFPLSPPLTLSLFPGVHVFVCVCVYVLCACFCSFVCLFVRLFVCLFVCVLFVCALILLFVCLSCFFRGSFMLFCASGPPEFQAQYLLSQALFMYSVSPECSRSAIWEGVRAMYLLISTYETDIK